MKLDVIVPVYEEEQVLERNTERLYRFLSREIRADWRITIAVTAADDKDRTLEIARKLAKRYRRISCIRLKKRGRGRALKEAWRKSRGQILCYMDADLATDLRDLPRLVKAIRNGADVAVGNRLDESSVVKRGLKRLILSHGYNSLARWIVKTHVRDLQCGFKAISKRAQRQLLPKVCDPGWFFDTELIVLAEKLGYQVAQIPVHWTEKEGRKSKVRIFETITSDVRNLFKLRSRLNNQGSAI